MSDLELLTKSLQVPQKKRHDRHSWGLVHVRAIRHADWTIPSGGSSWESYGRSAIEAVCGQRDVLIFAASSTAEDSAVPKASFLDRLQAVTTDIAQRRKFERLVKEWREATVFLSSVSAKVLHPAYQQIIGMGRTALPLILKELKQRPDHWFWALHAITGEDPARGTSSFEGAVHAWLDWAERKRITF